MAGSGGFNIVLPPTSFLERQLLAGISQSLDKNKLLNYKNLDPELLKLISCYDFYNKYMFPICVPLPVLAIMSRRLKQVLSKDRQPTTGFSVKSRKPSKVENSRYVIPRRVFRDLRAVTLLPIGKDPSSENAADYIGLAIDFLLKRCLSIRRFHFPQYINDLVYGDLGGRHRGCVSNVI